MVCVLCICIGYNSSFSVCFFSGSRILTLGEIPKDTIYPMKYPFILILLLIKVMSHNIRFPTMWYVQPAKPQINLPIRAV